MIQNKHDGMKCQVERYIPNGLIQEDFVLKLIDDGIIRFPWMDDSDSKADVEVNTTNYGWQELEEFDYVAMSVEDENVFIIPDKYFHRDWEEI